MLLPDSNKEDKAPLSWTEDEDAGEAVLRMLRAPNSESWPLEGKAVGARIDPLDPKSKMLLLDAVDFGAVASVAGEKSGRTVTVVSTDAPSAKVSDTGIRDLERCVSLFNCQRSPCLIKLNYYLCLRQHCSRKAGPAGVTDGDRLKDLLGQNRDVVPAMSPVPCGSLSSYRFEREFASRGIPVLMEDCLTKVAHCPAAQSGDVMERFFFKKKDVSHHPQI